MRALIDLAACFCLVAVAMSDMRRFRIPNGLVAALAILAICAIGLDGGAELMLSHGLFGVIALMAMAGAFALGALGGGDAKLLAVACLWVGPEGALAFSLCLLAATILYCSCAFLRIVPAKRTGERLKIPFGPSIAAAWIGVIAIQALR